MQFKKKCHYPTQDQKRSKRNLTFHFMPLRKDKQNYSNNSPGPKGNYYARKSARKTQQPAQADGELCVAEPHPFTARDKPNQGKWSGNYYAGEELEPGWNMWVETEAGKQK